MGESEQRKVCLVHWNKCTWKAAISHQFPWRAEFEKLKAIHRPTIGTSYTFTTHQSWHPLLMEYRWGPGAVGAVWRDPLRWRTLLWQVRPPAVASWCRLHQARPYGSGKRAVWWRASHSSFCWSLHFYRTKTAMTPRGRGQGWVFRKIATIYIQTAGNADDKVHVGNQIILYLKKATTVQVLENQSSFPGTCT